MTTGRHHMTNRMKSLIMIILFTLTFVLACWSGYLYNKNDEFFNKIKDAASSVIAAEAKSNAIIKQSQDLKKINETLKGEQDKLKTRTQDLENQVKLAIQNYDKKNKETQDLQDYVGKMRVYIKLYQDQLDASLKLNQKLALTKTSKLELAKIKQDLALKEKLLKSSLSPRIKNRAECEAYYQNWMKESCVKATKFPGSEVQVVSEGGKSVYVCLNEKRDRVPNISMNEDVIQKNCKKFK